jgi:uncharacterized protein
MTTPIASLETILEKLLETVPKLTGALLATTDGLPIAHRLERLEVEQVSAMISANIGLGKRIASSRGIDPMQAVIVQGALGYLCMYSVGDRAVLAVEATHEASLGVIHITAQRTAAQLEAQLGDHPLEMPSEDPWGMNVGLLDAAMEKWKKDLGAGLLSSDIVGGDGLGLISFNSNPMASALFGEITTFVRDALNRSGFTPPLGRYYMTHMKNGQLSIVMVTGEFAWVSVVDRTRISMGVLLNVALPSALKTLQSALEE